MFDMQIDVETYTFRMKEFENLHPGFFDVIRNSHVYIGREVQLAIMSLENSAEVVHFLVCNLDFAESLGRMHPLFALVEIGKLSAKLL